MTTIRKQALLLSSLILLFNASCSKKQQLNPEGQEGSGSAFQAKDSDSNNAYGLETVYFEFDSTDIAAASRQSLKNNAAVLKKSPNLQVQVEGHCDERGGTQYNLGLGERRAISVVRLLESHGIPKSRLSFLSMGKEKPVAHGNGEDSHAKNRRGNFVVSAE